MFQYNGWFEILDDPLDPEPSRIDEIVAALNCEISASRLGHAIQLFGINGATILTMHAGYGGENGAFDEISSFLTDVGERAPGSYGSVFIRDDESEDGNNIRVLVMTRGVVTERRDPFFSPIVPTIADAEPPGRDDDADLRKGSEPAPEIDPFT